MKNGKKPTLAQKKFLQDTGLDSEKWLIVKDTPEEIRKGWEEARLCANLIREGKAKIMIATRKDGTTYRYTKPK